MKNSHGVSPVILQKRFQLQQAKAVCGEENEFETHFVFTRKKGTMSFCENFHDHREPAKSNSTEGIHFGPYIEHKQQHLQFKPVDFRRDYFLQDVQKSLSNRHVLTYEHLIFI